MRYYNHKEHGINNNIGKIFKCECDNCKKEIYDLDWYYDVWMENAYAEPIDDFDACSDKCLFKLLEDKKKYFKVEHDFDEEWDCTLCNSVKISWEKLEFDIFNKEE